MLSSRMKTLISVRTVKPFFNIKSSYERSPRVLMKCTAINFVTPYREMGSQTAETNLIRKRVKRPKELKDNWTVVAYATAEDYNMTSLIEELEKQGLYQTASLPEDVTDVIHVSAKYQVEKEPREAYLFREGSVVFWNMTDVERLSLLSFLEKYSQNPYDRDLIQDEVEILDYSYTESKTHLASGKILLNNKNSTDLEKYTFSNAIALSVKLGIWEGMLEQFVDKIEYVTEDMKRGKSFKLSRHDVIKKIGELYALRHSINLGSDLLDIPDFYWDRENLEPLYIKMYNYLNIPKRTKVMNEKLNHCSDLMHLLNDHLNDAHHVRLELMIIALIMIEVLFEIVHYLH